MALCDIFYTLSVTGDCGNNGTGIIRVDIEGEISPADYTIEWLTPFTDTIELGLGVSSYVVNYLTTGSYSFNIINTCSPENTVQLVTAYISSGNCSSITEVVHTTCGQDNGSISVTSENSYGDTTYTIYDNNDIEVNQVSTSALSYTFDGLSGGTYYVISDDGYGCTAKTQSCVVLPSTTIDYDFYVVGNSSCNTSSSLGKIYITGLTGTPPFTYLWTNGETTDYITGLTQGSYSVTVGDSTGCEVTKTTFITNVPRVGLGGFVTESPSCFNNNGSVTVFVTGGTSPYYFSGSNGTTIATFAKEYTFNNLAAGYFGVYVSDSGLCTFTSNTFLIPPNGFSIVNMNISGARCSNNGGSIDIQLNGGNLNITYTLEKVGGDTISTTTTSVNQLFNFLSAGEYILTIEGGDCIYTETIEIEDISTFDIFSGVTATTCNNDNGVVEFGMTGESTTGEYSIELEGLPTIFISLPTTGYTFTNLPAGDLTYTIIDIENSCLKEGTINIPQSPTVDFSFYKTESNCGNGSICVNITSGEPTFTLEWSDNVNGQTGLTITNLSADTYTLKVTDSNGCFKEKSIDINGTNGLSTYQVFNVCDLTFENNGEILKKGPKQMLLEGYYDLITGDENCILNSATFTASVTINGNNVSNLIYTTTSLYDYPSDQVWYDELDDIISSFEGIGSVIIDPETNKIVITTDCNSETDLGDASVVVDMIIDYDISCYACSGCTINEFHPVECEVTEEYCENSATKQIFPYKLDMFGMDLLDDPNITPRRCVELSIYNSGYTGCEVIGEVGASFREQMNSFLRYNNDKNIFLNLGRITEANELPVVLPPTAYEGDYFYYGSNNNGWYQFNNLQGCSCKKIFESEGLVGPEYDFEIIFLPEAQSYGDLPTTGVYGEICWVIDDELYYKWDPTTITWVDYDNDIPGYGDIEECHSIQREQQNMYKIQLNELMMAWRPFTWAAFHIPLYQVYKYKTND